ncbi:uncharacterized protein C3orf85-like [Limanda limanda]|uniref:uncharacterized protein C3orf85-like n=1 Tax=Limanda limanda TaxID=27771 RepID=UPI0029C62338|nr:uncharacterized protein C3orf85-like [Limanda limanda]
MFGAPFVKEEEAKPFIRLKRQSGYWDPHHSQNQWGYTIQEQGTLCRVVDTHHDENNRLYMEMLRNAQAHLYSQTV